MNEWSNDRVLLFHVISVDELENSKHEIRNSKQAQNSNAPMFKTTEWAFKY